MEILSCSGKKYIINVDFIPEIIKVLISDDFSGDTFLPNNISDEVYDVIIPFLNTGRISDINKDIIDALNFLQFDDLNYGFSEDYLFPEDYQLLWLEESWTRQHLYKLPDFGDSRLIKLTDEIIKDINGQCPLFSDNIITHKFKIQSFDIIRSELNYLYYNWTINDNFVLAGGSLISILLGRRINDLDYFHINPNINVDRNEAARSDLRSVILANKNKSAKYIRTENSISLELLNDIHQNKKIQLILRTYRSLAEVVFGFDIDACSIILNKDREIYLTPKCLYSLKNRKIIVDLSRCSLSYEYRLFKYYKKGFDLFIPGFDNKKVNYRNIDKINSFYEHDRNRCHVKFSNTREGLIFDFYTNNIVINGLDILLYLIFTDKKNISISDYSYENEDYLVTLKGKLKDIYERTFKFNKKYKDYIYINDYTVNLRSFIRKVADFDIPEEFIKDTGLKLKSKLEFKVDNPGSQVCGSFHKKIISNPESWFSKYFYDTEEEINIKYNTSIFDENKDLENLGIRVKNKLEITPNIRVSFSLFHRLYDALYIKMSNLTL